MFRGYRFLVIFFAMALAGPMACGDSTSGGPRDVNNDRDRPDVEVPANSRLLHVQAGCENQAVCAVDASFTETQLLRVRLEDGNRNPIDGARILFDLDAGMADGSTLAASSSITGDDGIASVELRPGNIQGVIEVEASVSQNDTIEPVKFVIGVSPKDAASYRVTFDHAGSASIRNIQAYLFDPMLTCAQVLSDYARAWDGDPSTNPQLTAQDTARGVANVDGSMPIIIFPAIPNGTAYTVAGLAYARDNDEVQVAIGCQDGNDAVNNGLSVDVTVPLVDHLPRMQGAYQVNHRFQIRDAICPQGGGGVLPSSVCLVINILGTLATNPAAFIVGTDTSDGLLHLIVDFLPDGSIKDTIQSFLGNNFVREIGAAALNNLFSDWISRAPTWVQNTVNITADIYETLQEFRVRGIIRIHSEPDVQVDTDGTVVGLLLPDGEGVGPGEQVWNDIVVLWTGDCAADAPDACRERAFSAGQLGAQQSVVNGRFTGTVIPTTDGQPGYALIIDEHTLALNYGVLALGIIENIVFPSIFGPGVNSLESALETMIGFAFNNMGCQGFAESLNNQFSVPVNISLQLCNTLLDQASNTVRSYLTENLTLDGANNFLLGTREPCMLRQPQAYAGDWATKPLPYIESMGQVDNQCEWEVKIRISESTTIEMDGEFYGSKQ